MGAINFAANLLFGARDRKVNAAFNRMGTNSERFAKRSERSFKRASKAANSFKNITKGILAAGAIQKSIGLVGQGLRSTTSDFLGFDNAVISAAAKFKGLDLTTQKGIETLDKLKRTARDVAKNVEFNAFQAGQGLDFLALAGFNAEQAMSLLPGVTNLATVAGTDLATATDIASDSLGAFGLMTTNTAQLTKNFTRVQDVMAKTTATSNTGLTDLFEAIKGGAAAFTTAGQSMETFAALTGVMANSGLKGSKAGLVLKNMMNRLAKQSPKTQKMMRFLNLEIGDGKGKFADATVIIDRFNEATKDLTQIQRKQAVAQIFGTEIQTGMTLLLKEGGDALRAYRQRLIDAKGAAEKMAKIMRSSLMNRLKSLGSAATEVGFQLFSAFDKQGAKGIDNLTIAIRKIDLSGFIAMIKRGSELFGQLRDRFIDFGTRTGLFDKIKEGAAAIIPVFNTVVDIAKTLWKLFSDIGVFDLLAGTLKLAIDGMILLGKAFTKTWGVIKPIVQGIKNLFEGGLTGSKEFKDRNAAIRKQTEALKARNAATAAAAQKKEISNRLAAGRARSLEGLTGSQRAAKIAQFAAQDVTKQKVRQAQARTNPAQTQLDSKTTLDANIRLDIAGAPEGSTTTQKGRPAPQIQVNMLATQAP